MQNSLSVGLDVQKRVLVLIPLPDYYPKPYRRKDRSGVRQYHSEQYGKVVCTVYLCGFHYGLGYSVKETAHYDNVIRAEHGAKYQRPVRIDKPERFYDHVVGHRARGKPHGYNDKLRVKFFEFYVGKRHGVRRETRKQQRKHAG